MYTKHGPACPHCGSTVYFYYRTGIVGVTCDIQLWQSDCCGCDDVQEFAFGDPDDTPPVEEIAAEHADLMARMARIRANREVIA